VETGQLGQFAVRLAGCRFILSTGGDHHQESRDRLSNHRSLRGSIGGEKLGQGQTKEPKEGMGYQKQPEALVDDVERHELPRESKGIKPDEKEPEEDHHHQMDQKGILIHTEDRLSFERLLVADHGRINEGGKEAVGRRFDWFKDGGLFDIGIPSDGNIPPKDILSDHKGKGATVGDGSTPNIHRIHVGSLGSSLQVVDDKSDRVLKLAQKGESRGFGEPLPDTVRVVEGEFINSLVPEPAEKDGDSQEYEKRQVYDSGIAQCS